jgi:hypothetical protein
VSFSDHSPPERFDRIIANVGYRPNRALYEELRVVESEITGGPTGVAQALIESRDANAATAHSLHPHRLLTEEPNFYILGAKSFGRDPRFLVADGMWQIRDLFAMIGDRRELDLYATADHVTK